MKSELFNISAGVLQDDTLAPFLFAIVLDYAIRRVMDGKEEELGFTITKRRSRRHLKKVIADLMTSLMTSRYYLIHSRKPRDFFFASSLKVVPR